ncbi:CaiB/BaiF CoA transferase family protein [Bordetella bronchiseptica]|uniref:CaiB/BaiF CoA transferase family protein n=1 Tax=Bordetella bronchiseptica TaxID=518 RepID=UPI0005283D85|nr:CoA transferase [Bordetella bronchiseptica]AWP80651.1 CoA transferase [Bordetella bronchiseptica]KAB1444018.1 CoA transferase [Bordetella bronchiseptica]KAB1568801.1 CoA transferase [Bordetella bronchiseptica]SUW06869.1 acyl-CoA transferase [Bordetella bronchiseptica]VEF40981.1 Crotonobetainyl-CoA:carnitine CoA-transferase [Bordetella bronchiseptica]
MQESATVAGPFSGVRVLDLGHVLAGPFAATLLGDFGADVIKVERIGEGDAARMIGPQTESGPVWWKSLARNKRSIALDWTGAEGRVVLKRLVECSQVLIENFRPGVLERNGLSPAVLHEWNENLVILRISGYGQTGPYSGRPGFGKPAEALSGVVHLTGMRDGPPMHAGFALGDMSAGLMGAYGVSMALFAIERGIAKGQIIDLPIYEAPMRLLDYHIPVSTGCAYIPRRNGNQQPMGLGLSGIFRSNDDRWISYSAATLATARRVLRLVGGDRLAGDPRFSSIAGISEHDTEINVQVEKWMGRHAAETIIKEFSDAAAVAAMVYDAKDILADPHIAERGSAVGVPGETMKVVAPVPKLSATPGKVKWLGPAKVGQDGVDILKSIIGLQDEEIENLIKSHVIGA